jgi:hypothetical protein
MFTTPYEDQVNQQIFSEAMDYMYQGRSWVFRQWDWWLLNFSTIDILCQIRMPYKLRTCNEIGKSLQIAKII